MAEIAEQVGDITKLFYENTEVLIAKQSYKLGGERNALDVVRDIFRAIPVQ